MVAYGYAYAADAASRRIVRIDQSTDRITVSRRLALTPLEDPSALASDEGSVWLLVRGGGRAHLLHLDPGDLRVRAVFHLYRAPVMALAPGTVWLAFPPGAGRARLVGIDERTGRIRVRRRLPNTIKGLAVGPDGVWALSEDRRRRGRITLYEPLRGRPVRSFRGPFAPREIAVRPEYVWVTSACAAPLCDLTALG